MEMNGKPLYNEVPVRPGGELYKRGDWQNIPEIQHDNANIKGFFGDYAFLSNFGDATVELDGVIYPSVERAYQAAKWDPNDREFFVNCTNGKSITYNREHQPNGYPPKVWDEVKIDIMHYLLEQKFNRELNPENYQKLLETGDKYLEETNWWGDDFWGKTLQGEGKNYLGLLLMEIREKLKSEIEK